MTKRVHPITITSSHIKSININIGNANFLTLHIRKNSHNEATFIALPSKLVISN
jgi:hypothetical protein